MTYLPRVEAAKSAEWPDLLVELDRWEEAGLVAQFWWRDDDAVAPSPRLDRLMAVAESAPVALAVIPADVKDELAAALRWFTTSRIAAKRPPLLLAPFPLLEGTVWESTRRAEASAPRRRPTPRDRG